MSNKRNFLIAGVIISIGIILAIFSSCKKQVPIEPENISTKVYAVEIASILSLEGISRPTLCAIVPNPEYSLPSKDWVENKFSIQFSKFIQGMRLSEYSTGDNSCNQFSLAAMFFFRYLHHNTANKLNNTGIAFGEFYYYKDKTNGHAINIFLYKDEVEYIRVGFFEPQSQTLITLTDEEKSTCLYYHF